MPTYNFNAKFAPAVEAGQKLCTIRGRGAVVGETFDLYTGMRTKACRKLGRGTIVHCVGIALGYAQDGCPWARLPKQKMNIADFTALATADGFATPRDMVDWFRDQYEHKCVTQNQDGGQDVFSGFLITWELVK